MAEDDGASDNEDGKIVWSSLEHHAMTFPAPYKRLPKSVHLKTKEGKQNIELSEEAEEMATWWAEAGNTEFGEKQKVRENFWGEYKLKFDAKKYGVTALDQLDFS